MIVSTRLTNVPAPGGNCSGADPSPFGFRMTRLQLRHFPNLGRQKDLRQVRNCSRRAILINITIISAGRAGIVLAMRFKRCPWKRLEIFE
jgi:hypothetical protein